MEKIKLKNKLSLNKESIARLNKDEMNGIQGGGWSAGCTDGCGTAKTWLNCTQADCTRDCGTISCGSRAFCTSTELESVE